MTGPRRGRGGHELALVARILRCELLQILRDRRALFFAVVLPSLLYPLLFLAQGRLEEVSRESLAAREVVVAIDSRPLPAELDTALRQRLAARVPLRIADVDASALLAGRGTERERALALETRGESAHVLLAVQGGSEATFSFHMWYDVKDDLSREARDRVESVLSELDRELGKARIAELLGPDPAAGLELELVDVATSAKARGAALGRLVPLLAVILLLTGGSFAALSVFAGEREAGTLETLLVQPVSLRAVSAAKFLAVGIAGLATTTLNLASLFVCLYSGLGSIPELALAGSGFPFARILASFVWLPGAAFLCGLLCVALARAKTYREGQLTLLPLMLIAIAPTAIVIQPDVHTDLVLAAMPLLGAALCLRDALRGSLTVAPALVMTVSHLACTVACAMLAARSLQTESTLAGPPRTAEQRERALAGHALRWSFLVVLLLQLVAGRLQAWDLEAGLWLTFLALMPALTLLAGRGARAISGASWREVLHLRAPSAAHLCGAALLVPTLVCLARWYVPLQQELLPLPRSALQDDRFESFLTGLPRWEVIALFALAPGLFEELCFRGPLLFGMRARGRPIRAVLLQGLFFGAAHAMLWRIIPTAVLGMVFTALVLRTGSLWCAVLAHALYDGWTFAWALGWIEMPDGWAGGLLACSAVPGLVLLAWDARVRTRALPAADAGR